MSDVMTKSLPTVKLKSCIQKADLVVPAHELKGEICWVQLM